MQNEDDPPRTSLSRIWRTEMGLDNAPTLSELQHGEGFIKKPDDPIDPEKAAFKTAPTRQVKTAATALEEIELLPDAWFYIEFKLQYYRNCGFHRNRKPPPPEAMPGLFLEQMRTRKFWKGIARRKAQIKAFRKEMRQKLNARREMRASLYDGGKEKAYVWSGSSKRD